MSNKKIKVSIQGEFPQKNQIASVLSHVKTIQLVDSNTGRGQKLDLSLLDSMLAIQSIGLAMYFASREVPRRYGS